MTDGKILVAPYDAEVQYIATDGQAYIDTGYKPKNTSRIVVDMYVPTLEQNTWFFGTRKSNSIEQFALLYDKSLSNCDWRFGSQRAAKTETITPGYYTFDNLNSGAPRQLYINNSTTLTATANTFTCSYDLYLFTLNNAGSPSTTTIQNGTRLYKTSMHEGTTLILDFISVRIGTTGYLYDKVSGQLFGNAGSGAFTVGPDV